MCTLVNMTTSAAPQTIASDLLAAAAELVRPFLANLTPAGIEAALVAAREHNERLLTPAYRSAVVGALLPTYDAHRA